MKQAFACCLTHCHAEELKGLPPAQPGLQELVAGSRKGWFLWDYAWAGSEKPDSAKGLAFVLVCIGL